MRKVHDLTGLTWTLEGYTPYVWLFEGRSGVGVGTAPKCIDVRPVPATLLTRTFFARDHILGRK